MTFIERTETQKAALIAIMLTCVGYAFYNIGDAALKLMASRFHFSQIFLFNNIVILFCMSVYGGWTEKAAAFRTKKPKLVFMRALLAQFVSVITIISLPHIPLTTFYTLVFTSPFWVTVLSVIVYKDKLSSRQTGVVLFGFAVVAAVLRPGGEFYTIWTATILLSAFLYSWQLLLIRQLGPSESRPFMIMCSSLMGIAWSSFLLPDYFLVPNLYEWGLFLMMGVTGAIGLLCISYAFQTAPSASLVAPYHYTQIVWGALLGYFIFGERLEMDIAIGSVLIILSGLYLIRHERRRPAASV